MGSRTVVFDFDGVIHKYSKGWQDGSIYDEPNYKVIDVMYKLMGMGYCVAIVSTRNPIQISDWWNNQRFPMPAEPVINDVTFWNNPDYVGVFNKKIPAFIYIDDRGYKFDGNKIDSLIEDIQHFKTWQCTDDESKKSSTLIERIDNLSLSYKTFLFQTPGPYDLEIRAWCKDNNQIDREYCYTLASFEFQEHERCYELHFCCDRADDKNINWNDFGKLVLKAYKILNTDERVCIDNIEE